MLRWKEQFIDKYLENADRLSTQQLDMVIELAGTEVDCVVQILTTYSDVRTVESSGAKSFCIF